MGFLVGCSQERLDAIERQFEQQSERNLEMLNQRLETLQQQQQSQSDEMKKGMEQFSTQLKNLEVSLAWLIDGKGYNTSLPHSLILL